METMTPKEAAEVAEKVRLMAIRIHELETSVGMHLQRTVHGLMEQFGEEHPDFPIEDWRYDVQNGETLECYWIWVADEIASSKPA